MDKEIPAPQRDIDKPFLMAIEGTYHIAGRGCVVTGTIDTGAVKIGDEIDIVGYVPKAVKTSVVGIETFRKQLDRGESGDNIGLLIRGLQRDQVRRGQVICKPNSLTIHNCVEANIYILTEAEGGRKKPFPNAYRPQMFHRTADIAVCVNLPSNVKVGMPGDNLNVKLNMAFPLPVAQGQRFALREGGRTIAAGVISKVLPDEIPPQSRKEVLDKLEPQKKAEKKDDKPAATATGKPGEQKDATKKDDKKDAGKKDATKKDAKPAPTGAAAPKKDAGTPPKKDAPVKKEAAPKKDAAPKKEAPKKDQGAKK